MPSNLARQIGRWVGLVLWAVAATLFILILGIFIINRDLLAPVVLIALAAFLCWLTYAMFLWNTPTAPRVLMYIEQAVRLNLPLPALIASAASGESNPVRKRLITLGNLLEQGVPLENALSRSLPRIPRRITNRIAAAERIGRLAPTLDRIIKSTQPANSIFVDSPGFYRSYPWLVLMAAGGSVTLLAVFVLPKFQAVWRDTRGKRIPLPWSTGALIHVANDPAWQILWLILAAMTVLMITRSYLGAFSTRLNWLTGGSLIDHMIWRLPFFGSCAKDRATADLCQFIADSVEAGQAMDQTLRQAADSSDSAVLANRVRFWADLMAAGQTLSESARRAKMPALMVGMLATTNSAEGLQQVMTFLAQHYDSRFSRTQKLIRAAYVPAVVFILGFIVAFIELSVFQFMTALMQAQAHFPGGFLIMRHRGWVFIDAIWGLLILSLLAGLLATAANRHQVGLEKLQNTRAACRVAESILTDMQQKQGFSMPPDSYDSLTEKSLNPQGTWIEVTAKVRGRSATLIGFVPQPTGSAP